MMAPASTGQKRSAETLPSSSVCPDPCPARGSANRRKAKAIMARLHARIAQIRQDGLHKLTTALVQRFTLIGIEDLNVRAMMANHRLARSIADMGFHAFRLP
jgi:putative transposase